MTSTQNKWNYTRRLVCLSLSLTLLGTGSCTFAEVANNSIVPGKSIGNISLGEHETQAIKSLGPADSDDAASGHAWNFWKSRASHAGQQYELDVYTVTRNGGLYRSVEQVRVTSPWFKTYHKISVGSSLAAVKAVFPHMKHFMTRGHTTRVKTIVLYDDVSQGISFEFGLARTDSVNSEKCRAILIHPKGESASGEYYPWYFPDD